jgi:hypothetical protein
VRYRPRQTPRTPGGWGSQNFRPVGTWTWQGCQSYTGRLHPPGKVPGPHLCYTQSRPESHSEAGRVKPIKNLKDPIKNRNHELPGFTAMPQPNALRCNSRLRLHFERLRVFSDRCCSTCYRVKYLLLTVFLTTIFVFRCLYSVPAEEFCHCD